VRFLDSVERTYPANAPICKTSGCSELAWKAGYCKQCMNYTILKKNHDINVEIRDSLKELVFLLSSSDYYVKKESHSAPQFRSQEVLNKTLETIKEKKDEKIFIPSLTGIGEVRGNLNMEKVSSDKDLDSIINGLKGLNDNE
jgi:hypothetical protein